MVKVPVVVYMIHTMVHWYKGMVHCKASALCTGCIIRCCISWQPKTKEAELAQSVERTTLNRVVVGSIPTFGVCFFVSFTLIV